MTPLCVLAVKHDTDKYSKHRYTAVYYELFEDRIATIRRVLEIGIKRGASLRMWKEFFPEAEITRIDIKRRNLINEGRVVSYWGDQGDAETLIRVAEVRGPFDLIVDDGNHKAKFQVVAMSALLQHLSEEGIYVVEDLRHGPGDHPEDVTGAVPPEFSCRTVLTNDLPDSGLLIIRRRVPEC